MVLEREVERETPGGSTLDTKKGNPDPSLKGQNIAKREEETLSIPARPPLSFRPAKKSVRNQEGEPVMDEKLSVDDIDTLSGLILPKGASFKIDEIRLPDRSEIF